MSGIPLNLLLDKGDTFEVFFNLRDNSGNFINLTNYIVEAKMARNYSNTETQYNLNPTVINSAEGLIRLSIPATGGPLISKTQDIPEGRYVYNVRIHNTVLNKIEKVIEGIITVRGSVI